jgi:hypothetical protein
MLKDKRQRHGHSSRKKGERIQRRRLVGINVIITASIAKKNTLTEPFFQLRQDIINQVIKTGMIRVIQH